MPDRARLVTREEMLAALDAGWGRYLPTLGGLSEEQQARYARAQGFPRVQDLLAHLNAWADETLTAVARLQRGERMGRYDVDRFNAEAVARRRHLPRESVEAEFRQVNSALRDLIASLPAEILASRNVNRWLWITVSEHYDAHRPPAQTT